MHVTESVDNLTILPCRLNDVGSQRCWLEASLMSEQSIMLYDVVKINCTNRLSFLCRAWPRLDRVSKGYIQFDATVLTEDVERHDKLTDSFTDTLSIPVCNIQKVTCSAIESVSVTVVTERSQFVLCIRRSAEVLQHQMRNLLVGFVIAPSCALLCFRTALGKLFCWDRILFHDVVIKNSCCCGFITHSTEISVIDVVSKERFQQRTQKATVLGGLENEIYLLRSIVLQCQKYELSDSLRKKVSILIQQCIYVSVHCFQKILIFCFVRNIC